MLLAVTCDAIVKRLSADYPIHEVNALRYLLTALVVLVASRSVLAREGIPLRSLPILSLRGFLIGAGNLCFMLAAATISLADGVAIYFTMPFFVAGIVPRLIGERVPIIRWIAILIGFGGVIVMTRPGSSMFQPEALLALACAFLYGLGQVLTRKIDPAISASVISLWQGVVFTLLYAFLAVLFTSLGLGETGNKSLDFLTRSWVMPTLFDAGLIVAAGLLSSLVIPLVAYSYKHAEASFVAPFEYTAMVWAVLWGVVLFGDLPDWPTIIGAAIVIGAGIVMLRFDGRRRAA